MALNPETMTDEVYDFIADYVATHGYPPSTRDIASGCCLSRGGVTRYLDRLQMSGRIEREPGKARSIRLLETER